MGGKKLAMTETCMCTLPKRLLLLWLIVFSKPSHLKSLNLYEGWSFKGCHKNVASMTGVAGDVHPLASKHVF